MAEVTLERLQQIPLAQRLAAEQVKTLLSSVQEQSLSAGQVLFRQGEPLSCLYYIERGRVREEGKGPLGQGVALRLAGPGDYVGRYTLVTGLPPRVTAIAQQDTTLLAIPLRDLQPILFTTRNWQSWFFNVEVAARLRAIPLFQRLDDWDLYLLADQIEVKEVAAGEPICYMGDQADDLYVIDRGQVLETAPASALPGDNRPRYLAAGNFFGRSTLQPGELREATAVADMPSRLFRLQVPVLRNLFSLRGADLSRKLPRVDVVGRLAAVPLFSGLQEQQLRLLAGYVNLVYHRPGALVSRQGEPASGLLILDEGEAVIRRQIEKGRPRPVGYLKAQRPDAQAPAAGGRRESVYFGEYALLAEEIRSATVEVTRPSTWIVLNRSDFQHFLSRANLSLADLKQIARRDEQVGLLPPASTDHLELPYRTRRHWIALATQVLPLLLVMAGVFLALVADLIWPKVLPALRVAVSWVGLGLLLLLIPWTVWRYLNWRNDVFEVTSEAVAHLERVPFPFPREDRYQVPLVQIQNVSTRINALGRLLGYGNLSLDTAAVKGEVAFHTIPKPARMQELIQRAAYEARSGRELQFQETIRQQLENQLYPDRLKAAVPQSVLIQPEPPPPRPPRRRDRFRSPLGLLPRLEIREGNSITWRKHWLNLLKRVGLPLLAFLVTSYLVLTHILLFLGTEAFHGKLPRLPLVPWTEFNGGLFLAALLLWGLAILWMIYQYQDWRNDVYIVTDSEVIDVERNLAFFPFWFFYTESRRQASLDKVQNVNLQIPNLLASALGYGDVIVQTAGTEGTLDFLFVKNPRRVQAEILSRVAAHREREREQDFQKRWGGMAEWFDAYRRLVDEEQAERGPGPSTGP